MKTNLASLAIITTLALTSAPACTDSGPPGRPGIQGETGHQGPRGVPGRSFDVTDKVIVTNDVPEDDVVSVRCPDDHPYVLHGTCLINWEFAINGEMFLQETEDDNEGWACGAGAVYTLPYDEPTHGEAVLQATVVCISG